MFTWCFMCIRIFTCVYDTLPTCLQEGARRQHGQRDRELPVGGPGQDGHLQDAHPPPPQRETGVRGVRVCLVA